MTLSKMENFSEFFLNGRPCLCCEEIKGTYTIGELIHGTYIPSGRQTVSKLYELTHLYTQFV